MIIQPYNDNISILILIFIIRLPTIGFAIAEPPQGLQCWKSHEDPHFHEAHSQGRINRESPHFSIPKQDCGQGNRQHEQLNGGLDTGDWGKVPKEKNKANTQSATENCLSTYLGLKSMLGVSGDNMFTSSVSAFKEPASNLRCLRKVVSL